MTDHKMTPCFEVSFFNSIIINFDLNTSYKMLPEVNLDYMTANSRGGEPNPAYPSCRLVALSPCSLEKPINPCLPHLSPCSLEKPISAYTSCRLVALSLRLQN